MKVYVLINEYNNAGDRSLVTEVHKNIETAVQSFKKMVRAEKESNNAFDGDILESGYELVENDTEFTVWLDGYYDDYHTTIYIEEKEVIE